MLNFSKFQKTAEDGKTVTMRHEKGHEMRILLKALTPIEREQIKRIKMAKGGGPADAVDPPTDSSASPLSPTPAEPVPVQAAAPVPEASLQSPEPAPISIPQTPVNPPVLNSEGTMNPGNTAQTAQEAIGLQGKIDTQAAKAKANYDQQYLNERQRLADKDVQNLQEIKSHTDDFSNYIKSNPINPNLYGESQDGQQKVATGVGLFLGGLGGQGHSNLALDFLNKNIDRNIQTQRENVNNRKTVWGAYKDLYGDEAIANNLAKVSANDLLTHQVDLTAAQLGTQQAMQKAMQLKSQKAIENSKLIQESAVSVSSLPGYNPGAQNGNNKDGSIEPSGKKEKSPDYVETNGLRTYPILPPDAVQNAAGLRHVGYLDQAKLQSQLTAADQVDKVLNGPERNGVGGIHDLLSDMYDDTGKGSIMSSLAPSIGTGAAEIPYVGKAASSLLNVMGNKGYNDFMRKRAAMIQDFGSALQDIVPVSEITSLVDANLPKGGDTPQDREDAEMNIYRGIRKSMKTDELSKAGLLPKGRK